MKRPAILLLLFSALVASCGKSGESEKTSQDTTAAPKTDTLAPKAIDEGETPLDQNPGLKSHIEFLQKEWKDVPNPLKVKFTGSEMGDYFHLNFEDESGRSYDFGDAENALGSVNLYNPDTFEPNKTYVGKTFTLTWDWKLSSFYCCEGEMNAVKAKIPSIVKLEAAGK